MRLRSSIAALAAVAGALATAAPASAQNDWVLAARWQNLGNPLSLTTINASVECAAFLSRGVGTGIQECYLQSVATGQQFPVPFEPHANPGPADVVAGIINVPAQRYVACVRARTLGSGGLFWQSPTHCFEG